MLCQQSQGDKVSYTLPHTQREYVLLVAVCLCPQPTKVLVLCVKDYEYIHQLKYYTASHQQYYKQYRYLVAVVARPVLHLVITCWVQDLIAIVLVVSMLACSYSSYSQQGDVQHPYYSWCLLCSQYSHCYSCSIHRELLLGTVLSYHTLRWQCKEEHRSYSSYQYQE